MIKHRYKLILLFVMLMAQLYVFGQAKTGDVIIKGLITSKLNGETLIGVSVKEVNGANRVISGTVSDINGQYVLRVKDLSNRLVFSYIGCKQQFVNINSGSGVINVVLEEDTHELETVTIVAKEMRNDGALTIPAREISTAMQRVSTKEFEGVQVTSIDEALQGRIAGMDIVSNSGDPGSGTTIRIRGAASMNAASPPLIVINNIPRETVVDPSFSFASANTEQYANMLSINPDDVEDITVLKDAAATAIWGSKGANGVLLITTKKGVRGPTLLQYTYRLSRSVQPKGMTMLNGDGYTMMMKQAKFNPFQYEVDANVREYNYDPSFSEYQNFNNNTDWVKEVTQTGYSHDHYFSASGGGERATYRVSAGIFNQTGTVIGQKLTRVTARAELDYRVSDRLKFTSEFSFTVSDNDRNWRTEENDNTKMSLLAIAYAKMPNVSVFAQDSLGNNTDIYYNIRPDSRLENTQKYLKNPVALAYKATNNLKNFRIIPTLRLQYDILPRNVQYLKYNMYVSFDMNNDKTSLYLPREATNFGYDDVHINLAESADVQSISVQTENSINWQAKFSNEKHSLSAYTSFQTTSGNNDPLWMYSYGYSSSQISDASAEGNLLGMGSKSKQWRSMAVLGRVHYAYDSKYILDLILRRDGSTKFGKDKKYGNFPGISAKWIISDEAFMAGTKKWMNMLAIRPSWGISGNQPPDEYLALSRYISDGNYIDMGATRPTAPELTTLSWENSTSYNIGMDIEFFDGKYVFDLNYYNKRTDNLLQKNISLPTTSGYSGYEWQNVGSIENKGWELNFYGNKIIKTKDFTFDFNFNMGNNKNTIISLTSSVLASKNPSFNYENGEYLSRIQEGNSFGSIYGFRYKGVYQYSKYDHDLGHENAPVGRDVDGNVLLDNTGDPLPMVFAYGNTSVFQDGKGYIFKGGDAIYEDINHDGNIDKLDIVYLGNSNPKVNGGFRTSFGYKRLMVTAFFVFRYGNKIVNTARMEAENMYGSDNQSIAVNYRWRKDGDVTSMPRALYQYGYNWLGSDRYVEDGSFLRFKELTFRYSLPSASMSKFNIKRLDFYLTINNIAVLTKYTGVDPEVGYDSWGVSKDNNKTPRSNGFTLGITVGL